MYGVVHHPGRCSILSLRITTISQTACSMRESLIHLSIPGYLNILPSTINFAAILSIAQEVIFGDGCPDPRAIIPCYPIEAVAIDVNITLFHDAGRIHVKPENKATYSQEEFRIGETII